MTTAHTHTSLIGAAFPDLADRLRRFQESEEARDRDRHHIYIMNKIPLSALENLDTSKLNNIVKVYYEFILAARRHEHGRRAKGGASHANRR